MLLIKEFSGVLGTTPLTEIQCIEIDIFGGIFKLSISRLIDCSRSLSYMISQYAARLLERLYMSFKIPEIAELFILQTLVFFVSVQFL